MTGAILSTELDKLVTRENEETESRRDAPVI